LEENGGWGEEETQLFLEIFIYTTTQNNPPPTSPLKKAVALAHKCG
jgi:hypothetical protein